MARPLRPEPKFFLREDSVARGRGDYIALHFPHRKHECLLGEKSTSYIEHDEAIDRIRTVVSDALLVFVLRDPARRAYSNWRFSRSNGIEDLEFADALEAEKTRAQNWDRGRFSVCPYAYAGRGHYARYLASWAKRFPRKNMILVTSEFLFTDLTVARNVLGRLGVDPDVPLKLPGKINASILDTDIPLPKPALDRLRKSYRGDIQKLADEWGLDTTPWQT